MDLESLEVKGRENLDSGRVVVVSSGGFTDGNGSSGSINDAGTGLESSGMMADNGCNEGVNLENVGLGNEGLDVNGNEVAENCVIDVIGENSGDDSDGDVVCRICHLGAEPLPKAADTSVVIGSPAKTDLIQLGCVCKDELGTAHSHCAEAWFQLKGNRLCEICGDTAKNIKGTGNGRFIEEWKGRRFSANNGSLGRGRYWQGQSFCNFLMALLVIAFVLPWFFRINMF